jgi:uncharacterized protein YbjT (DUF2867 family)
MIHTMRVLVTGATGRVGRAVVDSLIAEGVPVRALTRRPEAAELPANVEIVTGDLTVPESLDAALRDVGADIERLIAAAGLESTIIRPVMVASNTLFWWAPAIRADGVVRWPYGAAETAPVDDRDVAAVAARTLYEDGHAGGDYVLTGPESLSQAEQVGIIGDVTGRRIRTSSDRRGRSASGRSRHRLYGRCRVRLRRTAGLRRRDRLGGADGDQQEVGS